MRVLVAAVGVVAFGKFEIGGGKFLGGDRPGIDPEPLEQCKGVVEEQFKLCRGSQGAVDLEIEQKG